MKISSLFALTQGAGPIPMSGLPDMSGMMITTGLRTHIRQMFILFQPVELL